MPPSHARHLVAEVLDKQIVDAKKNKLGKVDGLVIVLREGRPPRVAYIECGAAVLARRLGRWCERLALALNRRFGEAWHRKQRMRSVLLVLPHQRC